MKTFKLERKKARNTTYELYVLSICQDIVLSQKSPFSCIDNEYDIKRIFESRVKEIPRLTTAEAKYSYRATIENECVNIWHLNSNGEQDRLVCSFCKI